MLLTSAVTLAVAALALLSPLETRLREDGVRTIRDAISATRPEFQTVTIEGGRPNVQDLREAAETISRRANGAEVTILNSSLQAVYARPFHDLDVPYYFGAARKTLASGHQIATTRNETTIVVERLHIGGRRYAHTRYALIVVKHLQYVALAVGVVQDAFIVAAAAGLATALLLGIGIASRLLRRLERLRDATRDLEERGLTAPLPHDSGSDEIGELSRAFATMQAHLRRQEESRRAFIATASHELRTPLASLDGMLELLHDDLCSEQPDLDDARMRAELAREQTGRLSQLATDLLDLSRLDSEMSLRREPIELHELCRAVAAEFELQASNRGVTIVLNHREQPCWALADPGALARIVRILLDNALRFAPAGSAISITPSIVGSLAQVEVRDEGPGVPDDERERIFKRFTRGRATAGAAGFGLGLAIGRELAIRMDGSLTLLADDTSPHERREGSLGACFALALPALSGQEHPHLAGGASAEEEGHRTAEHESREHV